SEEWIIKLTEVEARSRRNEGRIRDLETGQEALRELATAVKVLAGEQQHQTGQLSAVQRDLQTLDGKVDALERRPARRWDALVEKVILAVATAVVTYFLTRMGLG